MELTGGCHCGALRYTISGAPLASMVCHCRTCQKISGAPIMGWLSVKAAQLAFSSGSPTSYASSPGVDRRHCAKCGTQLTYAVAAHPGYLDVATASLDEPSNWPPTLHSWLSHTIGWVRFGDGLPQHQKSRSG